MIYTAFCCFRCVQYSNDACLQASRWKNVRAWFQCILCYKHPVCAASTLPLKVQPGASCFSSWADPISCIPLPMEAQTLMWLQMQCSNSHHLIDFEGQRTTGTWDLHFLTFSLIAWAIPWDMNQWFHQMLQLNMNSEECQPLELHNQECQGSMFSLLEYSDSRNT